MFYRSVWSESAKSSQDKTFTTPKTLPQGCSLMREAKKSNYSKPCNKKELMAKDRWVHNALSKAPHWKLLKAPQNCFPLFRTWIKQIKLGLPSLELGYLLSQWHQEITSIWGCTSKKTAVLVPSLERGRGLSPCRLSGWDMPTNIAASVTPLRFGRMSHMLLLDFLFCPLWWQKPAEELRPAPRPPGHTVLLKACKYICKWRYINVLVIKCACIVIVL